MKKTVYAEVKAFTPGWLALAGGLCVMILAALAAALGAEGVLGLALSTYTSA